MNDLPAEPDSDETSDVGDAEHGSSRKELAELRRALQAVERERDAYLHMLKKLLPPEVLPLDEAELVELEKNGFSLEQALTEMRSEGMIE